MKKSIKSLFVMMMLSLIVMSSISLVSFAEEIALRIMATTDLHTSFTNYNYYTDAVNEQAGFVKIATLINKNKDEMKGNTLLFDNGDMLQGSPYGDYMAKNFNSKKEIYPMIEAMNLLGYDAATLGNHEFNYGLDYLNSVIKDAKFSYVSSNLYKNNEKDNYMKPYVILNKTFKDTEGKDVKVKVGVIGFLPPQIMMWDAANLTGKVSTKGILDTAKKYIPQMKKEGADIIIALAHTGMGSVVADEKGENVGYQLTQIDGIDAVVSGHSHVTFPSKSYTGMTGVDIVNGTVNGKPYVIAGSLGDALGVMDVVIDKVNNKWVVKSGKSSIQSVYDKVTKKAIENNKEVELIFDKGHKGTLDYIRGAIGETKSAIFSFLALGQDDSSIQLVNTAQKWYVEQKVKGTELRKVLESGKRFSLEEAVTFLEQGLEFIACIENKGIVHRDIKPENIIRADDGRIFFLDFGIARILGADSLTRTGAMMGPHTPGYAAPEQFNNLKKEIDSRADIFSLGVVTYECITGKNPFREGSINALEVLQKTETITPVQYSIKGDTQSQFMALLGAMMGKYPSRRPRTAKQAIDWLKVAKKTFVYE